MAPLFDPLTQALTAQASSSEAMQAAQLDELFRTLNSSSADEQNARPLSMPFPGMAVRDAPRSGQPPQAAGGPKTQAQNIDSRFLDGGAVPTSTKRQDRLEPSPLPKTGRLPTVDERTEQQRNAPTPDFGPTFGERLTNFGNALTSQGTVTNFAEMQRQRQSTFKMLRNLGFDDDSAKAAALNPDILKSVLASKYKTSSAGAFGKQVIWGHDEEGNWVPLQVSSHGEGAQTRLPPGVRAVPPGDIAQQQSFGRKTGQDQAELRTGLPSVMNNAAYMLKAINDLKDDPYLDYVVGSLQGSMISPNLTGASNRVQSKINQLLGKTFLQAFESLKGGGPITDIEGIKGTEALTRLTNQRMSNEDYRQAIDDLAESIGGMINSARVKAGLEPLPRDQLATPDDILKAAGLPSGNEAASRPAPVRVRTPEEALRLPPGTLFMTPDGREKVRP